MECNTSPFSDHLLLLPYFIVVTTTAQKVKRNTREVGVTSKLIICITHYDYYSLMTVLRVSLWRA